MISPEKSAASFLSGTSKVHIVIPPKQERDFASLLSHEPKTRIKNILLAQTPPEGTRSPYIDLEPRYKVKFTFLPFITVEGVPGKEFRKQRIILNDYSGIIFTSRNSIDHFFRICEELRVKMSQETKYFCTSEAIALYLQKYTQYRKRKVFFGDMSSNKELRLLLIKHRDATRFLYICADVRKDEIPSFMRANHFNFSEGIMYKTVPNNLKTLEINKFQMLVLFSPTGIRSLFNSFPKFKQGDLKIAAYGVTTAGAILDKKLKLHIMAPLPHTPNIMVALEDYLKQSNK